MSENMEGWGCLIVFILMVGGCSYALYDDSKYDRRYSVTIDDKEHISYGAPSVNANVVTLFEKDGSRTTYTFKKYRLNYFYDVLKEKKNE